MNNDIVIQSLTESFEVLKDSWSTKKEAITNCIVETEVYDGSLAMDMWLYVLKKNEELLNSEEQTKSLVYDVIDRFYNKHERYCNIEYDCKVLIEHIAPHIIYNEDLIYEIFGNAHNAGYVEVGAFTFSNFIPMLIACIFLQENARIVSLLMNDLSQNKKMKDVSIGKLLIEANRFIENIQQHEEKFQKLYKVTPQVKEALLSSLDVIKDPEIKAECTIAILSY